MPRVHIVGYLSIDRIETPTRRHDDVPGGAALYAALGARAAGAAVMLHAAAGEDFARGWLDALVRLRVDVAGVVHRPGPTRRARLVHTARGARRSDYDAQWWARTGALAPPLPADVAPDDVVVVGPVTAAVAAAAIARGLGLGQQLERRFHRCAQRPKRADKQFQQIVTGDVLDDPTAGFDHPSIR